MKAEDYVGRYPLLSSRRGVWSEVVRYIARDVGPVDTLVELGPGYADFINQFPARRKIAFDLNPDMRAHAAPEVDFRVGDATSLSGLAPGSVDLVFASNFLEHLDSALIDRTLARIHEVLRVGGKIALLQPNYRLCAPHYFDDPTHRTALSDQDLVNRLCAQGFFPRRIVPGLLPFSMKSVSVVPKWPVLVRAYLALPIKPGAAQMYVLGEKTADDAARIGGGHLER